MNIRKITKEDRQKVHEMTRVFYNSPAVFGQISDEIIFTNIDNCINDFPYIEGFVFEKNEQIIGYGMIAKGYSTEYGGLCIWIEDIYFMPEYRGQGIVAKFFEYIENMYKGKAVRYRLEVEENNENAIKAYKKNNFKCLGYVEMTKEV